MRIEPIKPQPQPTFGLNVQKTIRYDSFTNKRIIDTVNFENGKKLQITKYFEYDKLVQKLYYLKDKTGKWIKSILKDYETNIVLFSKPD